ncbi:MAG: hypothetical protein JST89_18805 [Cyanobacteria bacterium SZAS-4]|nr:hypothetical protein [Cyanobacteria bacterium SZAS-4]
MRRRKGSTLGLVAICVLVIIVIGIAVFFLTKIMAGGREVANTTDAGTLNTAKQMLKIAVPPETGPPYDFTPFVYPPNAGGITLLTYNRAVAAALLISINADKIKGNAPAKAAQVAAEVDKMGAALTAKLTGSSTFSDLQNNTRMWGNNGVAGTVADAAWMKSQDPGATNVYFNTNTLDGFPLPLSATKFTPLNNTPGGVVSPGKYMAGYRPINLPTGQVLFGTPVMPQQAPHLVSYGDFKANQTPFGSAPPNALHVDAKSFESKTAIFGGALACAIAGAIDKGGTNGPLGNGFEFAAALPSGYIEFLNWRANPVPPGYDPNAVNGDNIFNEEIGGGPGGIYSTWIAGDTNDVQTTQNVAFMSNANGPGSAALLAAWCNWAANGGTPPQGTVYAGKRSLDLKPGFTAANPPATGSNAFNTLKTIYALNQASSTHINDCGAQIASPPNFGLTGPCVTGFGAMQATFQRTVPVTGTPNQSQNFSQVDWAKATVIVAFQGKGGPNGFKTTNPVTGGVTSQTVNHNSGDLDGKSINNGINVNMMATDDSGLGAYRDYGMVGQRVPPNPNSMPVPNQGYNLPLEGVGTILQLMQQTMGSSCLNNVKADILLRCQQIQPKTKASDVDVLLNTPFPMAAFNSSPNTKASDQTANKLYIYLPNNDLSQPLQIDAGPPPGVSATLVDPDGKSPDYSDACSNNKYDIQGNLVDTMDVGASQGDEYVHQAPYVKMDPDTGMTATDRALWWPGSGALRTLGRLTFRETGLGPVGGTTFSQIN